MAMDGDLFQQGWPFDLALTEQKHCWDKKKGLHWKGHHYSIELDTIRLGLETTRPRTLRSGLVIHTFI